MKKIYSVLFIIIPFLVFGQDYYGNKTPNVTFLKSPEPQTVLSSETELYSGESTTFGAPTGFSSEVGYTEGTLSVSPTGSATYSVPIAVPPGITSTVPQISLSYNSQGGNNLAGYGWGISGVSKITRIASTKSHEAYPDPVDYDAFDRFALDGQRLQLKSGVYGKGGAIYGTENYSTLRITSYGSSPFYTKDNEYGPNHFKVEYPDGSFAMYGASASSISKNEWSITYWQSSLGVRINYEYINDAANNQLYISKISYGALSTKAQINEINFTYKTRVRIEKGYVGGQILSMNLILDAIRVKGNGIGYRNYVLGHDTTSLNYQRLWRITEWNGDNTSSLNPTVFTYNNTSDSMSYSPITTAVSEFSNLAVNNSTIVSGDFSGDGEMDFILYPTPTVGASFSKKKYVVYTDLKNASGPTAWQHNSGLFEEIIPVNYLNGNKTTGYKLMPAQGWTVISKSGSTETATVYAQTNTGIVTQYSYSQTNIDTSNKEKYYGGDFNGDGITDILSIARDYGGYVTFINLDPRSSIHFTKLPLSVGNMDNYYFVKTMVGDYDGDGKTDLFVFRPNEVKVYGFDLVGKFILLTQITGDSAIDVNFNPVMGDYNGDGKTDFYFPKASGQSEYRMYTSTGRSYIKTIENFTNLYYYNNNDADSHHYIATDYNNDGKSDLIVFTSSGAQNQQGSVSVRCYLNKNGKFEHSTGNYISGFTGYQYGLDKFAIPVFLNPNKKNPKAEIALIRNNKIHYFQSNKDFSKEKLLRTVRNGNGISETITYNPLLNNCTTSGCLSTYLDDKIQLNFPYFDIVSNPSHNVVAKLERQSNTTYQQQQYRYFGAVTNLEGLGFIGFKGTTKTNWYSDNNQVITNLTKFDINKRGAAVEDYMIAGFAGPSLQTINAYISKTINTIESELFNNKVYKSKITQIVRNDGLDNTVNTVTNTYDIYNNLTYSTTVSGSLTSGKFVAHKSQASSLSYDNLTGTPYIMGRLKRKFTSAKQEMNSETLISEELYQYPNGLLTQIRKSGHGTDYLIEDNEYDEFGNITKKTISAAGVTPRVTKYEYDPSGRFLTKSTDVEGLTKTFNTNSANGQIISSTDTNGLKSFFYYDKWDKETKVTDYLGKSKTTTYTVLPASTAEINIIGDDGTAAYTRLDDLGREIIKGVKNADGTWSYVLTNYDAYGRVVSVSQPYNNLTSPSSQLSTTKYDKYGRPTQTTSYTGKITTITYSGLTTTVNDGVQTITTVKNAIGDIDSKTDAGGLIKYSYYPNSSIKSASYGDSVTSIELDGWGRKKKLTDPSAGIYQYEYNVFGQITKEINPKGSIVYTYNNAGKLLNKICIETGYGGTRSYSYTPEQLLKSESWYKTPTDFQNKDYTYDYYKRLIKYVETTAKTSFEKSYTYDTFGRISTEKLVAGYNGQTSARAFQYIYKNGHLSQITDLTTRIAVYKTNTVNARGQVTGATYGNGINATTVYDQYGLPQQIFHNKSTAPATNIMGFNYVFDSKNGNLTSRSDMLVTRNETFKYDNLDRLTEFTNTRGEQEIQAYDNRGRITSNSQGNYIYDPAKVYRQTSLDMSKEGEAYYNNKNSILDGTMENKKGWALSTGYKPTYDTYKTGRVRSGNYSLKLASIITQSATCTKIPINISAVTYYTISGYANSDGTVAKAYLIMEKADGGVVEFPIDISLTPGKWTAFSKSHVVSSDVKKLSVKLEKSHGNIVWFDDVKIIKNADISTQRELNITYNMFKSPTEITESTIDKISISYYGDESRSEMYYGSMHTDKLLRPYRKFYSVDGTFEIKHNIVDNTIEFITYIGGDGYTAPVVLKKQGSSTQFLYLHRDYQGTISAISDQSGKVIERRQFDAWGNIVQALDANNNVLAGLTVLDRGYTGHEHLQSVGLINMNGRVYDPVLHRFLQPDNYVQLPYDTQSYNRYAYVLNNPLKYSDPSGETWLEDNWKTIVTVGVTVIVVVAVVAVTGGLAAPLVGMLAGTAGGFAGNFTGTMLNGGSLEDALLSGTEGALIGGFIGLTGGYAATFAPAGIIPGALYGGATGYTIGGMSNLLTGKSFNHNWMFNTFFGIVGGTITGISQAKTSSSNVLTGAPKPPVNAVQSFNNGFKDGKMTNFTIAAEESVLPMGGPTTVADNAINLEMPSSALAKSNNYSIYKGLDGDNIAYVGITRRDVGTRFNEHWNSGTTKSLLDYRVLDNGKNLSKIQARIWEQTIINQFGLQKNGGVLINQINSIAPNKWGIYGINP